MGDHIEMIDQQNVVGWRHYEVAKALKDIPKGKNFSLKLIEPLRTGFCKYSTALMCKKIS